jgi:hypothetical protein
MLRVRSNAKSKNSLGPVPSCMDSEAGATEVNHSVRTLPCKQLRA